MKKRLSTLAACLSAGLFASASASAADDWWFDIEVIIFDRNVSISELNEQFAESDLLEPALADMNLIEGYLRPDISYVKQALGVCGAATSPLWMDEPTLEQIQADHERWKATQTPPEPSAFTSDGENAGMQDNVYGNTDGEPAADSHDAATLYSANGDGFENSASTINDENNRTAQEFATADTSGNGENRFSDGLNDDFYDEGDTGSTEGAPVEPEIPPVTDSMIAEYWIDFSGINDEQPVSVPAVSFCEPQHDWLTFQNGKWRTWQPDNSLPAPSEVPEFLDGRDWEAAASAHLLPYDSLELTKLSRQIRQTRGINRMLHVAWRQPVKFGENKADAMRIIAGKNYAESFTLSGDAIEPDLRPEATDSVSDDVSQPTLSQDVFFSDLNARLDEAKPVSFNVLMAATPAQQAEPDNESTSLALVDQGENPAIWQLDGYLKVYLKYINRVPYLHIDSEMEYRQPVASEAASSEGEPLAYELKAVPFHQVRRVISKQIHYFDHPMFGMVVEIRRHNRPSE